MTFKAIVAMSQNRAIGKNGSLLWHIPDDLKFFKEKTLNSNIVFGKKTYENLPTKWLVNRNIWVLTRKNSFGWTQASTNNKYFPCVINIIESVESLPKENDYWICGGAEIYQLFLDKLSEITCTHVKKEFLDADAFMPPFEHLFSQKETIQSNDDFDIIRYFDKKSN